MSKEALLILLIVIALVAFYGGFLLGAGGELVVNQGQATNSPLISPSGQRGDLYIPADSLPYQLTPDPSPF